MDWIASIDSRLLGPLCKIGKTYRLLKRISANVPQRNVHLARRYMALRRLCLGDFWFQAEGEGNHLAALGFGHLELIERE